MSKIEKEECIPPFSVDVDDIQAVERMLASHLWKPRRIERQNAGLYMHRTCPKCGSDIACLVR